MPIQQIQNPLYLEDTQFSKLARVTFFVFTFFCFFGTMMPFSDSLQTRDRIGTSNLMNQLLSLLFVAAVISLWGKQRAVIALIRQEKFLTLFIVWSLASVLWSGYTGTSLKRWISFFGEITVCVAALVHFRWSSVGLRAMRVVMMIYFPLTILAVILVPEAIQWEFPAWRGLAPTKNNLGQLALISVVLWLSVLSFHKGQRINGLHVGVFLCIVASYVGAMSTTAFLIGAFLLFTFSMHRLGTTISTEQIGGMYAGFVTVFSILVLGLLLGLAPEYIQRIFDLFGKDLSFTGRADLWATVIEMTAEKKWLGWGYGGFWVFDTPNHLAEVFAVFIWIPNQSHQGYIDVYNQTGLVGIALLLGMFANYFINLPRLQRPQLWKWVFIGCLFLNLQESFFFRPRHFGEFMFIYSYLALHMDRLRETHRGME